VRFLTGWQICAGIVSPWRRHGRSVLRAIRDGEIPAGRPEAVSLSVQFPTQHRRRTRYPRSIGRRRVLRLQAAELLRSWIRPPAGNREGIPATPDASARYPNMLNADSTENPRRWRRVISPGQGIGLGMPTTRVRELLHARCSSAWRTAAFEDRLNSFMSGGRYDRRYRKNIITMRDGRYVTPGPGAMLAVSSRGLSSDTGEWADSFAEPFDVG